MHIGNTFSHFSPSHFDSGRHNGFGFGGPPGFGGPQGPGQIPGTPPQGGQGYTIQHGDTLWKIADRMRAGGDQRDNWDIVNQIAQDNGLKNPDMIFPGGTLNLRGPMGPDSFSPFHDPSSPITGVPQGPGAQGDGVPWIGQMNPAGADQNYKNADQNCGPAVMAMIAREHGLGGGMNDADLISSLGKTGRTDGTGTTGNGMIAMADQMNLKSTAEPGANSAWVVSQLQQGKDVVANGNYYALPQHADANQNSPHYILLTGVDPNGNITVEDPMDPNVRSITPGQLDQFNTSNPDGGFNIAFG